MNQQIESRQPPKISLKAARVNAGYGQKEAAKLLSISVKTLQRYEDGEIIPRWDVVEQIENLYMYPADYIFLQKKLA